MLTNRAVLGALAVVAVVAAGGGAYVANRLHPAVDTQTRVGATHDMNLPPGSGAVTETENSLTTAPAVTETTAQPAVSAPAAKPSTPRSTAADRQSVSRSRTASRPASA